MPAGHAAGADASPGASSGGGSSPGTASNSAARWVRAAEATRGISADSAVSAALASSWAASQDSPRPQSSPAAWHRSTTSLKKRGTMATPSRCRMRVRLEGSGRASSRAEPRYQRWARCSLAVAMRWRSERMPAQNMTRRHVNKITGAMLGRPRSADSSRVHSRTRPRSRRASRWREKWSAGPSAAGETAISSSRRRGWAGPSMPGAGPWGSAARMASLPSPFSTRWADSR